MASTLEELGIEKYQVIEVKRSQINTAPYNPRVIQDENRSRLGKGIGKVGLVEPMVWNKRTGVLVGGHQRLRIIDKRVAKIKGKDFDYTLRISAIDVNEIEEKAINLLLNNPKAQGEFTLEGLQPLLATPGFDLEAAGFDPADAFRYGGGTLDETIASIDDDTGEAGPEDGPLDKTAAKKAKESLTKLRDAMVDFDKSKQRNREQNNPDFYFLTVFRSTAERDAWLQHLGLDLNRYQSATELNAALRAHGVPPDADDGTAGQDSDAITSGSENAE